MQYPKELAIAVQQASRNYPLEGFVPGQGPLQPKLMIVGEAPGRTEIENFIPFSGQAGKELMKSLALAGLTREDVYITSAVRSRPYSVKERINKRSGAHEIVHPNRTPTKKEVLLHAPLLDYELSVVDPPVIATVGNIGLQRLLGNVYYIKDHHGEVIRSKIQESNPTKDGYQWSEKEYLIVPMYHPAAIFYNRTLTPQIEADWRGLRNILSQITADE
ncbi:uracil-DNA glycosylase [Enterococcus innesii]|uniref:uracil-DNA glycosylase n=1 Tax=Enterococcus innesii TaxID=2839759 RepID=UPI0010BB572D|nr:uracil-DNA glycosylase [Listeria monocytogenes]EAC9490731.1 uracil-DNA glycosylase [Listeria monocytogenes]EAG2977612.1 uracil-DNA glycosylase [Listeria monocytogenes]